MTEQPPRPVRIDRQLVGAEITVGGQTVQPVARSRGWYAEGSSPMGQGGAALVVLTPAAVTVRAGNMSEQRVAVTDPTGTALLRLGATAAAIAAVCASLILFARLTGRRARAILPQVSRKNRCQSRQSFLSRRLSK